MIPQVPTNIPSLPKESPLFIEKPQGIYEMDGGGTDESETTNIMSATYATYFLKNEEVLRNLNSVGNAGFLLNPNFNILSGNGLTPVTPAQGSDYEVIKQWYLVSGAGNTYTLTPEPISTIPFAGSSSNYFLNANISAITSDLYLYNLNYSLTGVFNSISPFSGSPVTFSFHINNNTSDQQFIRFSCFFDGGTFPDGSNEIFSEEIGLDAGPTQSFVAIAIPDLTGTAYTSSNFLQFRMYFTRIGGSVLDLDVYYVKAEASNGSSLLEVNPVLQQFICNNLV
jgi:hypothetical protein